MSHMFCNCSSLQSINLSSFNTNNVKDMTFMFSGCYSLQSIDLSSFNTTNVKEMHGMFFKCSSLEKRNVKIAFTFKTAWTWMKWFACVIVISTCAAPKCRKTSWCCQRRRTLFHHCPPLRLQPLGQRHRHQLQSRGTAYPQLHPAEGIRA